MEKENYDANLQQLTVKKVPRVRWNQIYKASKIKHLPILAKMLASTLLIVFLLSASSVLSIEDEQQSGICGCPLETIESFHEDRIPSKIVEQVCHQVGITCGASLERAPRQCCK